MKDKEKIQMETQSDNPLEAEVEQLQSQLREAAAAENFFETATGKLWTELATKEITRITRDITSDKYRKDQAGYNIALSDLLAYKNMLLKMQLAASPVRVRKINEKLDNLQNGQ